MQLFLNGGRAGDRRIVGEKTIQLMTSNQIGALTVVQQPTADAARSRPFPIGSGKDRFGFGVQIETAPLEPGMRSAGSYSWGGIYNTHFWIDPEPGGGCRAHAGAALLRPGVSERPSRLRKRLYQQRR